MFTINLNIIEKYQNKFSANINETIFKKKNKSNIYFLDYFHICQWHKIYFIIFTAINKLIKY